MFYCPGCAGEKGWPTDFWIPRSVGSCEICNVPDNCYDFPSRWLDGSLDVNVQVGEVTEKIVRTVRVNLGTEELVGTGTGRGNFRPDRLSITIENSNLSHVLLSGPMVRADGREYADGQRGSRLMTGAGEDTPQWIKRIIDGVVGSGNTQ